MEPKVLFFTICIATPLLSLEMWFSMKIHTTTTLAKRIFLDKKTVEKY